MISQLDVICPRDLFGEVLRRRWEHALPLAFEKVRFVERPNGSNPLLIAAERYPVQFAQRGSARRLIYLPAAEMQAYWIFHRKRPTLAVKRRVRQIRAMAKEDRFLAMSRLAAHGIAEEFRVPPFSISVLPPPVDTDLFQPNQNKQTTAFHVLSIGDDWVGKGGDAIIPLLDDKELNMCRWTFVARAQLPAQPNIRVITQLEPESAELVSLLQSASVLLLPTRAGLYSFAALEAFACGVPVIIRNIGAASEIVDEGKNGFVLDRCDPEDIKGALLTYIANPTLAKEHGRKGRSKVLHKNSLEAHAHKIREAFER